MVGHSNVAARCRALLGALGLAVVVAFASLVPPASAAAAEHDAVRSEQLLRQELGLRSDRAYVQRLRALRRGTVRAYGLVVTRAEASALGARLAQLERMKGAVRGYVWRAARAEFAGMYVDQRRGRFVVQFTRGVVGHRRQLSRDVPHSFRLRVLRVPNSAHALERTHEHVLADARRLARKGIRIYSVATKARLNAVEIGIARPTHAVTELLRRRYGSGRIRVVKAGPLSDDTRHDDPMPLKAGLEVRDNAYPAFSNDCTMAFTAYKYVLGGTQYYQLTAGHCAPSGSPEGANQYHRATLLGPITENSLAATPVPPAVIPEVNSDSASIAISSDKRSNRLYLESDPNARVTRVQSRDADVEGEVVCNSGKETLVSCGVLTGRDYTSVSDYNGTIVRHLRTATYEHEDGDSGGPVYGPEGEYEARGIHKGGASGDAVYSHIGHALEDLGLSGVYTMQGHEVIRDGALVFYRLGERNKASNLFGGAALDGVYKDAGFGAAGPLGSSPSTVFRGATYDSSLEVPDNAALDLTSGFTLEAWVNPTSYGVGTGTGIVYKGPSAGASPYYSNGGNYNLTVDYNGTIWFAFQYRDPYFPSWPYSYTTTTPATVEGKAPLGVWTHVVAVYDPSATACSKKMAIYLNGVQRACGPSNGPTQYPPLANSQPLFIGKRADLSNTVGSIDEVAIYDFPLPPARIASHYAARFSAETYKSAVESDFPVAYWELDDAPRLENETAQSAEGTYIGYDGATLGQPGVLLDYGDANTAAMFTGGARGEVDGGNAHLSQAGDFTVEAWVKPAVVSGTRSIVSKGATGSDGGNYWLLFYGDDFHFWYQTQLASCTVNCTGTNQIISWPSSKSAVVGQWYHVVATFDRCDFPATECSSKLYVNGVLEATQSNRDGSGNLLAAKTNSYPFRIGSAGADGNVYSLGGGTVDDVALYSVVLTDAQISDHYAARQ